jgi:hypothetical protein
MRHDGNGYQASEFLMFVIRDPNLQGVYAAATATNVCFQESILMVMSKIVGSPYPDPDRNPQRKFRET